MNVDPRTWTPQQQLIGLAVGAGIVYMVTSGGGRRVRKPPGVQTLSDAALSAIAMRIYAAFWSSGWGTEDEAGMCAALLECNNDVDVWKVSVFYPSEPPYFFSNNYDLFQAFAVGLNNEERTALNQELQAKGITIHM